METTTENGLPSGEKIMFQLEEVVITASSKTTNVMQDGLQWIHY